MRIFSKFYDYYDSVVGMGYDPTIIYKRVIKQFKNSERNNSNPIEEKIIATKNVIVGGNKYDKDISLEGFSSGFILFCGKYYPFVFKDTLPPYVFYWNVESLYKDHKIKDYYKKDIVEYFKHSGKEVPFDIFFELETPIIYFGPNVEQGRTSYHANLININLHKIQFYKVLDAWQTFQELSMFVGGVLGSGRPQLVEIKDKDMMYKKGFDDKSFKTLSPGKKFKRRSK